MHISQAISFLQLTYKLRKILGFQILRKRRSAYSIYALSMSDMETLARALIRKKKDRMLF